MVFYWMHCSKSCGVLERAVEALEPYQQYDGQSTQATQCDRMCLQHPIRRPWLHRLISCHDVIYDSQNLQSTAIQNSLTTEKQNLFKTFKDLQNFIYFSAFMLRLQCFDAVGWAAGRASGL